MMLTIGMILIGLVFAYLLGSIPTAVIVGRAYMGIDIREHGSGNAGATNTFRVLGVKPGSFVMIVDIAKGFAGTALVVFLLPYISLTDNQYIFTQLAYGIAAVIGHIYPVFAKFKGGKGVATLLGMVLAINPIAALACIAVFLIVFLAFKYVSLGSMLAALAFPIIMLIPRFNPDEPNPVLIVFGFALFLLVVFTHQKNIRRLLSGEESKANLRFRKNND